MKHVLKPPGYKRLKLKCDVLLTIFAFKFNLRRYIEDGTLLMFSASLPRDRVIKIGDLLDILELQIDAEVVMKKGAIEGVTVGRCRLTLSNPR